MMKDAWNSYKEYAWGANELAPVSRRGRNGGEIFGNTNNGASIIDSLSTLHIMGLDEEFELGRNWTAKEFDFNKVCSPTSVFETTIRFVGGLLSAYALSKDPMFLEKAMQVADSLLPAFETPFGVPYPRVTPCRKVNLNVIQMKCGLLMEGLNIYLYFPCFRLRVATLQSH